MGRADVSSLEGTMAGLIGLSTQPCIHGFKRSLCGWKFALLGLALLVCPCSVFAEVVKFRADDWIIECDTAHQTANDDCSIIGVFRRALPDGARGSFSLLVDLKSRQLAVVGEPVPARANLRIDKNQAVRCTGIQCTFSNTDAETVIRQLQYGSLILIDVFTAKSVFQFSLSTKGFQAGMAKIQAMGYRPPTG